MKHGMRLSLALLLSRSLALSLSLRIHIHIHTGRGELLFSNGDHYTGEWMMDKASGQVRGGSENERARAHTHTHTRTPWFTLHIDKHISAEVVESCVPGHSRVRKRQQIRGFVAQQPPPWSRSPHGTTLTLTPKPYTLHIHTQSPTPYPSVPTNPTPYTLPKP
jgi:hypothetical protein